MLFTVYNVSDVRLHSNNKADNMISLVQPSNSSPRSGCSSQRKTLLRTRPAHSTTWATELAT